MPRPSARRFICRTNSSSFPEMYSAIATQASFALATEIHLSKVSTVCFSPVSRKTWEPPIEEAYSEIVTSSSNWISPSASASKIKSIVMTFVTLAGGRAVSASFSYNTVPVVISIKITEGAVTSTAVSGACSVSGVVAVSSARTFGTIENCSVCMQIRMTANSFLIVFIKDFLQNLVCY